MTKKNLKKIAAVLAVVLSIGVIGKFGSFTADAAPGDTVIITIAYNLGAADATIDGAPTEWETTEDAAGDGSPLYYLREITIPEPERPNYNFDGWTFPASVTDMGPDGYSTTTTTVTFTATWSGRYFPVSYDLNGGDETSGDFTTQEGQYGGFFTISGDTPVYDGYVFKGWSANGSGSYQPGENVPVNSTGLTLTAIWEDPNAATGPTVLTYGTYQLTAGQAYTLREGNFKVNSGNEIYFAGAVFYTSYSGQFTLFEP